MFTRCFRVSALVGVFLGLTMLSQCSKEEPSAPNVDPQAPDASAAQKALDEYAEIMDTNEPFYEEFEGINLAFCTSQRVYMTGDKNGRFPDFGQQEMPNEMGGIWHHPFKLLDGFWVKLADSESGSSAWLDKAGTFINLPYGFKNIYTVSELDLQVTRFQFCPDDSDGLVVSFEIENSGSAAKQIELTFLAKIDLLTWKAFPESGPPDGTDSATWDATNNVVHGQDGNSEYHVLIGSDQTVKVAPEVGTDLSGIETTSAKNGISTALKFDLTVPTTGTTSIRFFIVGASSKASGLTAMGTLLANHETLLSSKIDRLYALLQTATISIPDQDLKKAYDWAKFHTDWLVADISGIGEGLYGTLPAFPWWMPLDTVHALRGVVVQGRSELVENNLRLFKKAATGLGGRIPQSVYTDGSIDPGDPYEVALFVASVYEVFIWTGDTAFVAEMWDTVKEAVAWVLAQDTDGDFVADGQVQVESHSVDMEPISTAVYTYLAINATAQLATVMGDTTRAADYQTKAATLKSHINDDYWVASTGRYSNVYGTGARWLQYWDTAEGEWTDQNTGGLQTRLELLIEEAQGTQFQVVTESLDALQTLDTTLKGMDATELAVEGPWPQLITALGTTPVEAGMATADVASLSLTNTRKVDDCCYGYEAFGSLAVSECRYGYIDHCFTYVRKITEKWSEARFAIAELFDIYPVAYPMVAFVFGIQPDAFNKAVAVKPWIPQTWAAKDISISKVLMGNAEFSMFRKNSGNTVTFDISMTESDWTITLNLPKVQDATYTVNGKSQTPASVGNDSVAFTLTGASNQVVETLP